MNFYKKLLNVLNGLFNLVVILFLIIAGLYSSYGLWDNHRIYAAAQNVQDDMLEFKPSEEELNFEDLLEINSDVKAWLTLDNTNIDYPILQGKTNLSYFNTDVYGEFSLAGSIFLDTRNNEDFTDNYSLIYGHHMANNKMFGDLDLYKEKTFFNENKTGTLLLEDRIYDLKIFATLIVPSGEQSIFNPLLWQDDISHLKRFTINNNLYVDNDIFEETFSSYNKILSLTTCSTEFTDARTVVLAVMIPR